MKRLVIAAAVTAAACVFAAEKVAIKFVLPPPHSSEVVLSCS